MSSEEYNDIVEDIGDELGVDTDKVIMPEYKVKGLYESLSEEEFRQHMTKVLQMVSE